MTTSLHERLLSALGTALVLALFGYILVIGLTVATPRVRDETMALLSFQAAPAPKAPIKPPSTPLKRSRASGARRSRAAPNKAESVVPVPDVRVLSTPSVSPLVVQTASAITPSSGDGGWSGAGHGAGEGDGAGGDGRGDGDAEAPPRLIRGRLTFSDLPSAMRARGAGGMVSVRYDVEADGKVSACIPIASSGDAELDQRTCQLIRQRFRFDPARDHQGKPVRSTIEEEHSWDIDKMTEDEKSAGI